MLIVPDSELPFVRSAASLHRTRSVRKSEQNKQQQRPHHQHHCAPAAEENADRFRSAQIRLAPSVEWGLVSVCVCCLRFWLALVDKVIKGCRAMVASFRMTVQGRWSSAGLAKRKQFTRQYSNYVLPFSLGVKTFLGFLVNGGDAGTKRTLEVRWH